MSADAWDSMRACGCVLDDDPDTDGVLSVVCHEHRREGLHFEYRVWQLLRAELDAVVLGRGTREAPERKVGAVFGDFAIARPKR